MTSETTKKFKWRINYWVHKNGKLSRGSDVIDAPKDFDEDKAVEILDSICQGNITVKGFDVLETNFFSKYVCADLMTNFGVLSVKRVK